MTESLSIGARVEPLTVVDGPDLPVTVLVVDGSMRVPADEYPITVAVALVSMGTDGESAESSFKSRVPALTDEAGWFQSLRTIEAPLQDWAAEELEVAAIPDFALIAPRAGALDAVAVVSFMEGQDPNRLLGEGRVQLRLVNENEGYLDWSVEQLAGDRHVASLAVAASAVDGVVHKSEVNVIRRFFRTRYEGRQDAPDLRARASVALQRAMRRLETGEASAGHLIEEASSALRQEYDMPMRVTAYDLAIRVSVADRVLAGAERSLLEAVSSSLGLPQVEIDRARHLLQAESQFVATYL